MGLTYITQKRTANSFLR